MGATWHVWRRWRAEDDRGPAGPVPGGWSAWECYAGEWCDEEDARDWAETLELSTPRACSVLVLESGETPYLTHAGG